MAEPVPAPESQSLVSNNLGNQLNSKPTEAALLLTAAPIETLKNELDSVSGLGPHYYALNTGICTSLKNDRNADQLRATLLNVNEPMNSVSKNLRRILINAHTIYTHNWEPEREPERDNPPVPITKEMAAKLLEPSFQSDTITLARQTSTMAAEAARLVRDNVIPVLSKLEADIENYELDYTDRVASREKRKKSWVPAILLNFFFGTIEPTPMPLGDIQELPQRVLDANSQIRRLPGFFDNLELHFRRLSEIDSQKMVMLGYTTSDDLIRLYHDRRVCDTWLYQMDNSWYPALPAFAFGARQGIP